MAQQNAMEAVLTGTEWDESKCYASGENEIKDILRLVNSQANDLKIEEALDFGCRLGGLSFALGQHFEKVTGIGISKKMIEQATLPFHAMGSEQDPKPQVKVLSQKDRRETRHADEPHSPTNRRKVILKSGGTILYSTKDGRAGSDFESIFFLVRKN